VLGPFLSLSGLDSSGGSHFLCCCKEVETHLCFKWKLWFMCNHRTLRNGAVRKACYSAKSRNEIRNADNITICSPPPSWDAAFGNSIREGCDATFKATWLQTLTERPHLDTELYYRTRTKQETTTPPPPQKKKSVFSFILIILVTLMRLASPGN